MMIEMVRMAVEVGSVWCVVAVVVGLGVGALIRRAESESTTLG